MTAQASHPAWGEWIEIDRLPLGPKSAFGLTPHGVSGLKLLNVSDNVARVRSHPAWGEWIEIILEVCGSVTSGCLTPHGVSGLKSAD